jgi:hypothetical protein
MTAAKVKRCPRCGQIKPTDQFYRRRRGRRLSSYCRSCPGPPGRRPAAGVARTRPRSTSCG